MKVKSFFISALFLISFLSFAQNRDIISVMTKQSKAWNDGNLEGFMQGYWKNDSLVFIGKNGPTFGWQKTLNNYKKSYPSKQAMGILTFSEVKVKPLGKKYCYVTGKWRLDRRDGNLQGYYTLLFEKIDHEWKIISDHSS